MGIDKLPEAEISWLPWADPWSGGSWKQQLWSASLCQDYSLVPYISSRMIARWLEAGDLILHFILLLLSKVSRLCTGRQHSPIANGNAAWWATAQGVWSADRGIVLSLWWEYTWIYYFWCLGVPASGNTVRHWSDLAEGSQVRGTWATKKILEEAGLIYSSKVEIHWQPTYVWRITGMMEPESLWQSYEKEGRGHKQQVER